MGGAALHEEEDDAFGAGGEVRLRIADWGLRIGRGGGALTGEEVEQGEVAEAGGAALEQGAAGEGCGWEWGAHRR